MRLELKTVSFEGTSDEFENKAVTSFLALLGGQSPKATVLPSEPPIEGTHQDADDASSSEDAPELTTEIAKAAMTRIGLSDSQKDLLRAMLDAGDEGVLTSDMANAAGLTRPQIAGVMGALGRRMTYTPGWPQSENWHRFEWDDEAKQWRYWLADPVREVLEGGQVTL